MVLSVSRRTDIPAFYSDWFYQRIKDGFVCVRNPMNNHQISRIKLSPDVVDCIVFWTKNPEPMLSRLDEINMYDYYFQFTLNNYGTEVEPNVPSLTERIDTFKRLSDRIGKERVIWRYDPIFFSNKYTPQVHLDNLMRISEELKNYTEKCVFSFVDVYPSKNSTNLMKLNCQQLSAEKMESFVSEISKIAKQSGLVFATCAEAIDLEKYNIQHNSCIDRFLIERITGSTLKVNGDGQRTNCGCIKCDDIGSYDTCPHGCAYCYANYRPEVVGKKISKYDVNSILLCDSVDEEHDRISDRPVKSYKSGKISNNSGDDLYSQLSLF